MVSFDGRQQLTVDLEDPYDVDSRTSEVDDISLRLRTRYSSAHLLTSLSRHVTSDLLTVAICDGRISVDIRTAADHKVRSLLMNALDKALRLYSSKLSYGIKCGFVSQRAWKIKSVGCQMT